MLLVALLIVILLFIGGLVLIYYEKISEEAIPPFVLGILVVIIVLGVFSGVALDNHNRKNTIIYNLQVKRNLLIDKYEYLQSITKTEDLLLYEGLQDNVTGIYYQINEYNSKIINYSTLYDNFWLGFLYPKEFSTLEPIDLGS